MNKKGADFPNISGVRSFCRLKREITVTYQENRESQIERVRLNNQRYRVTAREYVLAYLLTHPCSICGETDPRVLEFHHEGDKESEVSRLMGRGASLDALRAEIAKCFVVCANCHRRITADEKGWYKSK